MLKPFKVGELAFSGTVDSSELDLVAVVSGATARGLKERSMGILVPSGFSAATKVTIQIKGDQATFFPLHTGMPSVPVEILVGTFLPLGFLPLANKIRAVADAAQAAGPIIELWVI